MSRCLDRSDVAACEPIGKQAGAPDDAVSTDGGHDGVRLPLQLCGVVGIVWESTVRQRIGIAQLSASQPRKSLLTAIASECRLEVSSRLVVTPERGGQSTELSCG